MKHSKKLFSLRVTQKLNSLEDLSKGRTYYRLTVMCVNEEGVEVSFPEIRYKCRNFPSKSILKGFNISFKFKKNIF